MCNLNECTEESVRDSAYATKKVARKKKHDSNGIDGIDDDKTTKNGNQYSTEFEAQKGVRTRGINIHCYTSGITGSVLLFLQLVFCAWVIMTTG